VVVDHRLVAPVVLAGRVANWLARSRWLTTYYIGGTGTLGVDIASARRRRGISKQFDSDVNTTRARARVCLLIGKGVHQVTTEEQIWQVVRKKLEEWNRAVPWFYIPEILKTTHPEVTPRMIDHVLNTKMKQNHIEVLRRGSRRKGYFNYVKLVDRSIHVVTSDDLQVLRSTRYEDKH
jgi:hypothetical protein